MASSRRLVATMSSCSLVDITRSASAGYVVFMAARACAGDGTVLVELLGRGCYKMTKKLVIELAAIIISLHGDGKGFQDDLSDFGRFGQRLVDALRARNYCCPETITIIAEAPRHYERFMACDTDRSGTVSREEFAVFAGKYGISRQHALENFELLDVDRNGQISFSEWLGLPPVHDKHTFNCAELHGLTRGNVIFKDTPCAWCGRNISKGKKVLQCRRCHCHACLNCVSTHLVMNRAAYCNPNAARIVCKRNHMLTWRHTMRFSLTICHSCEELTAAGAVMFSCRAYGCALNVCVRCMWAPPSNLRCKGLKLIER